MTGGRTWVPGERLSGRSAEPDWQATIAADAPTVGVLALQGDVLEHLRVLGTVGARPVRVRRPEQLQEVDALFLPGCESTTIGKMLRRFGMLEPLQARVAGGLPVLGTCAGMILLADELDQVEEQPLVGGLGVRVRRNAFGRQVDSFDASIEVAGIDGGPMDASFIRAPWVTDVRADDVEVLGTVLYEDADGPGERIVVVRRGALLATSFHPELTGDTRLHALFVDELVEGARRRRPDRGDGRGT